MTYHEIQLQLDHPWLARRTWDKLHWARKRDVIDRIVTAYRAQIEQVGIGSELPLVDVEIDAYRTGFGELDRDNLMAGLKPYLDAMEVPTKTKQYGVGLILNDTPKILLELRPHQERIPKREEDRLGSLFVVYGRSMERAARMTSHD